MGLFEASGTLALQTQVNSFDPVSADLQRHPMLTAATTRALRAADMAAARLMSAAGAAADSSSAAGGGGGGEIGGSAAEQRDPAAAAAAQAAVALTSGVATRALRVLGEVCAAAVGSCSTAAGSGSAAAEQLLQGGQEVPHVAFCATVAIHHCALTNHHFVLP